MVVNIKGQIVIPRRLRVKFGIYPGQDVEFEEQNGKLLLVKKGLSDHFRKMAKKYKFQFPQGVKTTRAFLQEVRGT